MSRTSRFFFRTMPLPALAAAAFLFITACQAPADDAPEYPVDVAWVRQSVEYAAICRMTYREAWRAVKAAAAETEGDWVVVLDVDETVLDNSRYQEVLFERGIAFPEYWDDWVREEACPPVPGAVAFIDSVRSLGPRAHIAYITNRNAPLEAATRANLDKVGLWREGDVLLCQVDRSDSKVKRRNEVKTGSGRCAGMGERTILALVGDQLADVTAYPEDVAPEAYRGHYRGMPEWGTRWFILPNPMYGYWARGYAR